MLTWQVSREEKGRPYSTMANTSKSSSKLRILYAEGDSEVLASQSVTIEKAGYSVTQAEGRKPVQARVGINTGEVVVRSLVTDAAHAEYTPIGHSIGLAARMQAGSTRSEQTAPARCSRPYSMMAANSSRLDA